MKAILKAAVALSALASPLSSTTPPEETTSNEEALLRDSAPTPPHQPMQRSSPQAAVTPRPDLHRHLSAWDAQQRRLKKVNVELEALADNVVQMKPEEIDVLEPVLIEMFMKRLELDHAFAAARDGMRRGLIPNSDLPELQQRMQLEIDALEDAVLYLRNAVDDYIGQEVEL